VQLSAALKTLANALRAGQTDIAQLEAEAMQTLTDQGWKPDYVVARRRADLQPAQPGDAMVVLAAARLEDDPIDPD